VRELAIGGFPRLDPGISPSGINALRRRVDWTANRNLMRHPPACSRILNPTAAGTGDGTGPIWM
jgi:hypothetical protein